MGWLQEAGLAGVYDRDIFGHSPLLEAMSYRGMPVLDSARHQALVALVAERTQTLERLRALIPDACLKVKVYKKKPNVLLSFVPSPQQLVIYLKHQGLRVPKKDGRDTTEETALRRLALANPQDPVLPLVLQYRSIDKDRRSEEHTSELQS